MRILLDHLYQDLVGPLVQDLCIRVLWTACVRTLYDHLCKISVSGSFWTTVSGSCWTTCARSVLGSLCEDSLDHLYQDPAGALVQDPCYEDTCARSLYQDPVGSLLSGSCRTTSARSLSQDLCVRIHFWAVDVAGLPSSTRCPDLVDVIVLDVGWASSAGPPIHLDDILSQVVWPAKGSLPVDTLLVGALSSFAVWDLHQDIVNEQILRDFLENWRSGAPKRAFCARLPRKLKIRTSKKSVLLETSSKTEAPDFQNERFVRDFLENWRSGAPKRAFCARLPRKLKIRTSKTSVLCETSSKTEDPDFQNERFVRDFLENWRSGAPKRAFCARLPRKLKIRTSKMSILCETSTKMEACFRSTAPATKSWPEVIRNAALATQTDPQVQVPKMQPFSGIQPFDLKT